MTGGLVTTDDNDRLRKGNTHLKTFPSVIVFRTWPFIDKLLSAEKTQMHLKETSLAFFVIPMKVLRRDTRQWYDLVKNVVLLRA